MKHTLLMLTNSLLHLKSDAFGSKIAPSATIVSASSSSVANRGAHKTLAGLVFQAHNGLKCHPMRSKCLIGHIHTSWLVLLWDNLHFSMLTSLFFAKTHKTLIFPSKTEVRSRSVWPVGPLLGLKIASVRRPCAHETLAGLVFQAHNGLKCHPMSSKVLSDTFIPHVMPKPWNHWFYFGTTHTFRCSRAYFCIQNLILSGPKLHLRRLPWRLLRHLSPAVVLTRL